MPARRKVYDHKFTLYLTSAMWEQVSQAARLHQPPLSENEWLRAAIRAQLDADGERIGSRRHFQRSFQSSLDAVEENLSQAIQHRTQTVEFSLHVLLHLLAFTMAHVLSALLHRQLDSQQLLQKAVTDATQGKDSLMATLDAARHDLAQGG